MEPAWKRTGAPLAVLVVFLGVVAWGWHHFFGSDPITNAPPRNATIVAFGDSLTAGSGASPGHDYPSELSRLLGLPVINRGVGGDTTARALARLEGDVLALEPGLVIVILGGNDYLHGVDAAVVERNLSEIVERLHASGATVVLGEIRGALPGADYGRLFERVARSHGAALVPNLLKDILTNPARKSDPIHPNDEGYRLMAERIAAVVAPLMKNRAAAAQPRESSRKSGGRN
ncbi:MAG: GDSL-type esterase/lipase family protein [Candidatus Sumerlaeaceae bacterium]